MGYFSGWGIIASFVVTMFILTSSIFYLLLNRLVKNLDRVNRNLDRIADRVGTLSRRNY